MKSRKTKTILLVAALVLFTSQIALGQTTGRLKGSIGDGLEVGIGWAQVIVKSESRNFEIKVEANGSYEIELPEGEYTVIGQAKAFKPSKEIRIKITSGQTTELKMMLDVDLEKAECILTITGTLNEPANEKKQKPDKN